MQSELAQLRLTNEDFRIKLDDKLGKQSEWKKERKEKIKTAKFRCSEEKDHVCLIMKLTVTYHPSVDG